MRRDTWTFDCVVACWEYVINNGFGFRPLDGSVFAMRVACFICSLFCMQATSDGSCEEQAPSALLKGFFCFLFCFCTRDLFSVSYFVIDCFWIEQVVYSFSSWLRLAEFYAKFQMNVNDETSSAEDSSSLSDEHSDEDLSTVLSQLIRRYSFLYCWFWKLWSDLYFCIDSWNWYEQW